MPLSKTTQAHEEIRKWAEARGAQPAEVKGTHSGDEPGILRFCFPNAPNRNDSKLHEISWDEFFEKFDENGLELIYQEKTADGETSNFNKLIYPEDEHAHGKSSSSRTSASHGSGSHASASKPSHGGSHTSSAKSSGTRSHSTSGKSSHSGSSKSSHSGSGSSRSASAKSSGGGSGRSSSGGSSRSSHSSSSRKKAA